MTEDKSRKSEVGINRIRNSECGSRKEGIKCNFLCLSEISGFAKYKTGLIPPVFSQDPEITAS